MKQPEASKREEGLLKKTARCGFFVILIPMEENQNNKENQKEVSGGIEFNKEKPVEFPIEKSSEIPRKKTETVGGVEFAKEDEKKTEVPEKKFDDDAIHTMSEDMGEQAERKQGIALQEVLKQEREGREQKKVQEKNIIYSLISIVLFAAAIGVFVYANKEEETVTPATQVVQESIIYAENHARIDTTNIQAITLISNIGQKVSFGEAGVGEVTNLYFTRGLPTGSVQTLSTRQFFSSVQSSIPGVLLPMIGKDFMFGVFTDSSRKPFFILEAPAQSTLGSVKGWESSMLQDFGRIFNMDIRNPELYSQDFVDYRLKNKDMRVLLDGDGNFVFGYSYLNDDLLVFVTEESTFNEILQRLATRF